LPRFHELSTRIWHSLKEMVIEQPRIVASAT
jgi:hypothetical protein